MGNSIVRENLMKEEHYSPYCGDNLCKPKIPGSTDRWPRTQFDGEQFKCPKCGWVSGFPKDFIEQYKKHWKK